MLPEPALIRLILAQICLHACMAGTRMAAPLMALREGHSEWSVGVLLALFALTQVFLAIPAGRFADRHGLRRPLGISVAVACGGVGLAAAWPSFATLCVAALCTGGASGAAVIALQRHVGRAARGPTELKQVFSWLAIGPAFSNFIGPFSAGLLIDHAGFRAAFLAMALLPLLTWWLARREQSEPAPPAADAGPRRAWDLLHDAGFRRLLLVNWMLSACWDVHTFVVPVLGHERGLSASAIGSILGAFAIAAVLVRLALPLLAARIVERQVLGWAMLCSMGLFAVYPFMPGALAMGLCSVLLGLALGAVQPMVMSTLHQITPDHRHGEALGLRLMAINASSVSMPLLFGLAGTVVGLQAVFWATAALVGGGARLAFRLPRGAAQASGHAAGRSAGRDPD